MSRQKNNTSREGIPGQVPEELRHRLTKHAQRLHRSIWLALQKRGQLVLHISDDYLATMARLHEDQVPNARAELLAYGLIRFTTQNTRYPRYQLVSQQA